MKGGWVHQRVRDTVHVQCVDLETYPLVADMKMVMALSCKSRQVPIIYLQSTHTCTAQSI